jgi:hypothetical protein
MLFMILNLQGPKSSTIPKNDLLLGIVSCLAELKIIYSSEITLVYRLYPLDLSKPPHHRLTGISFKIRSGFSHVMNALALPISFSGFQFGAPSTETISKFHKSLPRMILISKYDRLYPSQCMLKEWGCMRLTASQYIHEDQGRKAGQLS